MKFECKAKFSPKWHNFSVDVANLVLTSALKPEAHCSDLCGLVLITPGCQCEDTHILSLWLFYVSNEGFGWSEVSHVIQQLHKI